MKINRSGLFVIASMIIVITIVTALSIEPEETTVKKAGQLAEELFKEDAVKANKELEFFSLYLPDHFEIKEESKNNLILDKDGQTFILFYNALENTMSELNFQAAAAIEDYSLLKSFSDNKRFGYIFVGETPNGFELQIGVGGVKITTFTTQAKLREDTESMMKMANSIAYTPVKNTD